MDVRLKQCKRAIRVFLRTAYTDERLVWLLGHAKSGRLSYNSCCCLVGVATANHTLEGRVPARELPRSHYALAKLLLGASEAEYAYLELGLIGARRSGSVDDARRRRLIPMIKAELRRREWYRAQREAESALAVSRHAPQLDVFA